MSTIALKRQFITDATGQPIGVIVPWEEFARVDALLQQQSVTGEAEKMAQMEQAAQDYLFMADLREAMKDFAGVDTEWWEQPQ
jgi:hypothetical protein